VGVGQVGSPHVLVDERFAQGCRSIIKSAHHDPSLPLLAFRARLHSPSAKRKQGIRGAGVVYRARGISVIGGRDGKEIELATDFLSYPRRLRNVYRSVNLQ